MASLLINLMAGRKQLAGHIPQNEEAMNAYRILVIKCLGKRSVRRTGRIWEDKKVMDIMM